MLHPLHRLLLFRGVLFLALVLILLAALEAGMLDKIDRVGAQNMAPGR
jgi:hypothetical protein